MLGLPLKIETVSVSKQKKHPDETPEQRVHRLAAKQEKIARMQEKELKKVNVQSAIWICEQAGKKMELQFHVDEGRPDGVAASPGASTAMAIDDSTLNAVCTCSVLH